MDIDSLIKPIHVLMTIITVIIPALMGGLVFLWRISRSVANMSLKMDMLWNDFEARKDVRLKDE